MKTHYRVVVIGGGVVGASALYQLANVPGYEPVWSQGRRVGFVTPGGFGRAVGESLAMALVVRHFAAQRTERGTHAVGQEQHARVNAPIPHDPPGVRIRA